MATLTELYSRELIQQRVRELGKVIGEDYKDTSLIAVCVLKGAVVFFTDLLRALDKSVTIDFMRVASYGSSVERETNVRVLLDLDTDIAGKHVLLVEDIVDTGYSLQCLLQLLQSRKPASIKICALLDKRERREVDIPVDYAGFVLDSGFVVGYGLDYAEDYRHLEAISILDPGV